MNLQNKPPVLIPQEYWREIEKLSKATLMDMVWDYAMQIAGTPEPIEEFRKRREIILHCRKR